MGNLLGRDRLAEETERSVYLSTTTQEENRHNKRYKNNYVQTAKYTWWNFIPLNLIQQFRKAANVYFLVVAFLQTIDLISISNGKSAMAFPLVLVISLSMIKDAYEDYKRKKNDDSENNAQCRVFDGSRFVPKKWYEVYCGDILKLENDESIPADILILSTSDEKGNCFVETKNLDGETNLKLKSTQKKLFEHFTNKENDQLYKKLKDMKG